MGRQRDPEGRARLEAALQWGTVRTANPDHPDLPFGRPAAPLVVHDPDPLLPVYPSARPLHGAEVLVPVTDRAVDFSFLMIARWVAVEDIRGAQVVFALPSELTLDRHLIRGVTGWGQAAYREATWLGLPGRVVVGDSLSRASVKGTRVSSRQSPRHVRVVTSEFMWAWINWLRPREDR